MLDILWRLLRPVLFSLDAETAHEQTMRLIPLVRPLLGLLGRRPDPSLARTVAGLRWAGPVGLAAGLDKDGVAIRAWASLGFGAVEVGTVTAQPQPGNPRPRLFRLVPERALINRMGFNNRGAAALADRMRALREAGAWPEIPVGANIGKSKVVPNEEAVADYLASMDLLAGLPDYFTVNVSSPNTPGLRALQEREPLRRLLGEVVGRAAGRPVLLKIAPDLEPEALAEAVDVAATSGCAGVIATNTTLSRPGATGRLDEAGGLSGEPLRPLALARIRQAVAAASGRLPIIGAGGISSAADAQAVLEAGAAATQLYSGLIFGGPGLPGRIHAEMAAAR